MKNISRREATKLIACSSIAAFAIPSMLNAFNTGSKMLKRKIPSTGQPLSVIGLGTWQSFDIGNNSNDRERLSNVLLTMKKHGGQMIDSSPMYGNSEKVVGDLTTKLEIQKDFFYATKVWTTGKQSGIAQMKSSLKTMNRKKMDLMQIHNIVDWKTHVKTLKNWKEKEIIKYWGITHYTNSSHDQLSKIIKTEKPDFVQFNYSIDNRHAEHELISTAVSNNTAIIINRPYNGGSLFKKIKNKPLPKWAKEYNINSWGQFFLKYILSNKAINCVIPGTSKPHHALDNMMAGYGVLPDDTVRKKMYNHFKKL
ncbi:aldo/keto reductase [Aquimarina sp. 2201CG1-2-11]|uniref:aldo/keto reductase n=1 Tax=Aquimarina discodermiae TaxID=3231043 RepID=UPI003461FCE0